VCNACASSRTRNSAYYTRHVVHRASQLTAPGHTPYQEVAFCKLRLTVHALRVIGFMSYGDLERHLIQQSVVFGLCINTLAGTHCSPSRSHAHTKTLLNVTFINSSLLLVTREYTSECPTFVTASVSFLQPRRLNQKTSSSNSRKLNSTGCVLLSPHHELDPRLSKAYSRIVNMALMPAGYRVQRISGWINSSGK
jgi:hypothetical protein